MSESSTHKRAVPRRDFLRGASVAGAAAVATFPFVKTARGAGEKIHVGLIGCGGRGTGAALNILQADTKVIYPPPGNGYHTENAVPGARPKASDIEIVALADLFPHRLAECRRQLAIAGVAVPDNRCFTGWEAYEKLLGISSINYVILATPPQFRPREFRATVEAGKNVFLEKPAAVDAPGVRSILATGELAAKKGLAVGAGTQRRHQLDHLETVKRIHDGAIGELIEGRAYFNVGAIWAIPHVQGWSALEWQHRNWPYFTWLSGDSIVEQHIHMLDLMNWVFDAHPVRAYGVGGRISHPPGGTFGHVYDHFAVEYEYPNGGRMFSQNRQIDGCDARMANAVVGSKGTSNCENSITAGGGWRYQGKLTNPYEQEHIDLIASIRSGNPVNKSKNVAWATMTSILGREAAYTGKVMEWDTVMQSQRNYSPDRYEFGDAKMPEVVNPATYRFL